MDAATMAWTLAALNVVAALAAVLLAVLVLAPRPRRPVNFALAAFLLSTALVGAGSAAYYAPVSLFLRYNGYVYSSGGQVLLIGTYLIFVGAALRHPIASPVRWLPAQAAIASAAVLIMGAMVVSHARIYEPAGMGTFSGDRAYIPTAVGFFVAMTFSLVAGILELMSTRAGTAAHRAARAYVAAFATLDVGIIVTIAWKLAVSGNTLATWWLDVAQGILLIVFVALLARGLLRQQLFDFDLKLKLNLKRGTVAATFVGVFLVVAQVAQEFLTGAFGWLAGGLAAGALLLAIRPIDRAADRLAERAMPQVRDTPEYRTVKKREVYQAAVESAMGGGGISDKERNMLATLADQLGLGAKETLEIEREARGTAGVA